MSQSPACGLRLVLLLVFASALLPAAPAGAEESKAERRTRVESLPPGAKEDLLEHFQRFERLEPSEQERLRRLNQEVESDPHAAELRHVMQRYYDWLKTLPPYQQAELRDLPPAERVAQIKRILDEQYRKNPNKGPHLRELARNAKLKPGQPQPKGPSKAAPEDIEGLLSWIDRYAKQYDKGFLEKLPPPQREELAQVKDPLRRQELLGLMWLRWQLDNPGKAPPLSDRDLADLRAKLSPATRKRLESRPAAEQWRVVSGLIPRFMLHQYAARRVDALPRVNTEELSEFFEHHLTAKQRDQLLSMPSEEMLRELWKMYFRWKAPETPHPAKRPGGAGPKNVAPPAKGPAKTPPPKPSGGQPPPAKTPAASGSAPSKPATPARKPLPPNLDEE
jgi:hypothetical protein